VNFDEEAEEPTLTSRLHARNAPGLLRRSMPDGGEVVTGPTARRALRALGARAMTMDRTIFVDEDFDVSRPEDAALYAHEQHHARESGGSDAGHGPRDEEEIAARAIERMVLHRRARGEDLDAVLRDARDGITDDPGAAGPADRAEPEASGADPAAAYLALRDAGRSHAEIVDELARHVLDTLAASDEQEACRRG